MRRAAFALLVLPLLGLSGWHVAAPTRAFALTTTVDVHVTEWEFSKVSPDTARAGTIAFTIHNDGMFTHDFSIAGNTTRVVVVEVDPGYDDNPGHPGTGTVAGVLC